MRPDGLYILNVRKIDERIRIADRFIASFEPSSVVAVGARQYSFKPVEMLAKLTGGKAILRGSCLAHSQILIYQGI